jgi:uncharacterized protein DUF222/HNH endonuclease
VREAAEQLKTDALKVAGATWWAVSDADVLASLDTIHQVLQVVAAARLHLIRQIDIRDLATTAHARTTAAWLRDRLTLDTHAARHLVDLATALDRHPAVDAALSAGTIDTRQAAAITDSVDLLQDRDPDDRVDAETVTAAEARLVEFATEFAPAKLRRLGGRILDHVAPGIAEAFDARILRRQERRAYRQRGFTLSPPVDGSVRVGGYLSIEDAAVVAAALDPLCSPRPGDDRTPPQLRADALVDVCRLAMRTTALPDNGGEPPQITVTVPFNPLTAELGTAVLDNGERLTPATARRLACDAKVLPIVLGGDSQILDVGQNRRLATGPLRRALVARDRGCAFPACDRPARWCDAHHIKSWTTGGPTSLTNLVLLCRHHHTLVHDSHWTIRLGPDDLLEFHPPPILGQSQPPRRNRYHRRT